MREVLKLTKTGGGCDYDHAGAVVGPWLRPLGCRYDFSGVV